MFESIMKILFITLPKLGLVLITWLSNLYVNYLYNAAVRMVYSLNKSRCFINAKTAIIIFQSLFYRDLNMDPCFVLVRLRNWFISCRN